MINVPFGNVNVKYSPCKSVAQLKYAANYVLGKLSEQIREGITKTLSELYTALGSNRDNFANSILITRKLNGKSYSKINEREILAHKISISFHPKDNDKLSYGEAMDIGLIFANEFFYSKGYEVLIVPHIDTEHIHVHFLIGNCNMDNGKSFQRNQKVLYEMSEFFGAECLKRGLVNSVRDEYYNPDSDSKFKQMSFAEKQMKVRGKETYKDELRQLIQVEIAEPGNNTFEDIIRALKENYKIEARVAGDTVSFSHPEYKDKNGKPRPIRGGKLGELYTKKGIEQALENKAASMSVPSKIDDEYIARIRTPHKTDKNVKAEKESKAIFADVPEVPQNNNTVHQNNVIWLQEAEDERRKARLNRELAEKVSPDDVEKVIEAAVKKLEPPSKGGGER
jgi:hypothetical protein